MTHLLELYCSIGSFLAILKVSKAFEYKIGWNILYGPLPGSATSEKYKPEVSIVKEF